MKHIFIVQIFFILANASCYGQSREGNLSGFVQNDKQEFLPGVLVELENTSLRGLTDEEGFFQIRHIPPGTYMLRMEVGVHQTFRSRVDIQAGSNQRMDWQVNEVAQQLQSVTVIVASSKKYAARTSTSGTRLGLALVETPQTIQVIPQQIIQDQQAQNLNDVAKNMTGVVTNSMYTSFTMRGFLNSYNNQFVTFDGFIGNMYWWNQMIQLYNIDRVEEIAGPASALFSTGSPGGVINMVTKKPLERPYYQFNLASGSWGLVDASVDLGGPLTRDHKLLYRLNVGFNNQNSFRPHQFNLNALLAPSLTYQISDRTSVTLDYVNAFNRTRFVEDHGGLVLMNKDSSYDWKHVDIKFLFNSPKDYGDINNHTLTLRFNHQFSDHFQWSYMSRYIWSELHQGEHYGNYYANNYFITLPDTMQRAYDTWTYKNYNLQNSFFVTWILPGKKGVTHTLVGGVDYQVYGDTKNRYVNGPAPSIPFQNPNFSMDQFNYPIDSTTYVYDAHSYNRQIGGYLQYLLNLGDRLRVLVSGRYEDFRFTLRPNSKDSQVTNDSSLATVFLPRFGLVYSWNKNQSVYGSYCESFTPQYDNMRSSGGPFPPQKGKQVEIGYKGLFFEGKLLTSLGLYHIQFTNVLAVDPRDSTGVHMIAIPGLTSTGGEVTVQGNLNKKWSLIAGYAYNHVVFLENSPLGPKGGRYDNAPAHVANFWIKYTVPERSVIKGLHLALGGKYVGDRVGISTNQHFVMPPYFVLDASASYDYRRWSLAWNGYNLLDRHYAVGYYASDLMVQVGAPFNWKLSLHYTIK